MILTSARADVDEAVHANMFGAWSDLVVGDRPEGLVDSYLLRSGDMVEIATIWNSEEDHNRAVGEEANHPAKLVFEACGLDPAHTVFEVIGSIHNHQ